MNAETMRRNAFHCRARAETLKDEAARLKYLQMADAWNSLADNKDWLDGVLWDDLAPLQPELVHAP
jgi:hypothetical protein